MSTHHLGRKYSCYSCHTKFYDLGKTTPVCPKCGADQRDADVKPVTASHRGRRVVEPPPPPVEPEFDVEETDLVAEESVAEAEDEELEAQEEAPPILGEEEKEADEEEDEEF